MLQLLQEYKMVYASESQTEQHEALFCLLHTFGSNLGTEHANKIDEPHRKRLENQKHYP